MARAAIVDVDGTLVDTNYHHALAWHRALRRHGVTVPMARLHRHVGMGGDKFVAAVAGEDAEERLGERLRAEWEREFDLLLPETQPLPGAKALVVELQARGLAVVLASSSIQKHLDAFVERLGVRDVVDAWTTKDDVDASKPDPDLVRAALDKARTDDAAMIGDTPWDVEAARRAGIPTVCVTTGGFADAELRAAGAVAVFESLEDLRVRLDETPLAAG